MIVDAHAHVFTTASSSQRQVNELVPAERTAPITAYRSALDSIGATSAILVPLDPDDEYVASVALEESDRFGTVGVVGDDPARVQVDAVDAIRLQWIGDPRQPVAESPQFELLTAAAERGVVLWTYLFPGQLPLLSQLARALPDLRIVLNHLGFCPHDMRIDAHRRPAFDDPLPAALRAEILALAALPNIHVLFSGHYALARDPYPYESLVPFSEAIADRFGAERLLWGSDYPWIESVPGYRETYDLVEHQLDGASPHELTLIRGGTAAALFPRLKGRP